MDIESLRKYALGKPSVTEGFPFGENVLVFKAFGKMFLLMSLDEQPLRFNVKCDPEKAMEWRERYPESVLPGHHMNKTHWNTVLVNGSLSVAQLKEMVDDSYRLITAKPTRNKRHSS